MTRNSILFSVAPKAALRSQLPGCHSFSAYSNRKGTTFFSPSKKMAENFQNIIRNILQDIRIELSDEFDQNFGVYDSAKILI